MSYKASPSHVVSSCLQELTAARLGSPLGSASCRLLLALHLGFLLAIVRLPVVLQALQPQEKEVVIPDMSRLNSHGSSRDLPRWK